MSGSAHPKVALHLADVLHAERRLVGELIAILLQQRDAVAADDLAAVDRASHALQRSLFTLADARRRRRVIGEMLGANDANLPRLEALLGDQMTAEVDDARSQLVALAGALAREVETNRRILRQALVANDRHVATLVAIPETVAYRAPAALRTAAGSLIDFRG
jgi:hypothetical protein